MADGENSNGMSLWKMVGLIILIIVIAAGTSYGVMRFLISSPAEEKKVTKQKIGPTYSLGDFVVNLSGSGGYQFVKASIVVEVDQNEVVSELEKRSPQIRDRIITILRDANLEAIQEPEAITIKNLIINHLNSILNTGKIENVFFTKLVVQ